jgi:serine protease
MKPFSKITYSILAIILLLITGGNNAFAQKKSAADYEANVLLVKVKPEYKDYFTDQTNIEQFKAAIAPTLLTDYFRTFPTIAPPTQVGHIDLTRIYTLTFSGKEKSDLPAFTRSLMGLGIFEYVELKYIQNLHAAFYPNDPGVTLNYQNFLGRMMAYEAWAIEQGDPNLIIGIIDTGVDYTHQDMTNNIAYNLADPINGIDDDHDGYIDNYQGWDLAGNDNDPNVYYPAFHGANVAGIAAATVNNSLDGAGIAFNSKVLPVKVSVDGSDGTIVQGYEGVIYAANHGCKVINLSWGATGNYSAADQDMINYAAINKDVLIVAAAGNTDEEADYYPAAYDNVLSVIAMDTAFSSTANQYIDIRASFTNWTCCYKATYAHSVDIGAQGMNLYTIRPGNYDAWLDGSSAASPVVAGAAALVRSHYPAISALQAAELLRVTADVVDTFPENAPYKEKMGKGRINIYKALTDTKSPSIRYKNLNTTSPFSTTLFSGDTVFISADFFNYLRPSSNLMIDLSSSSADVEILTNTFNAGMIDSLQSKSNAGSPFKLVIKNSAQNNESIEFRIGYTDAAIGYYDYQYFKISVNPDYTTLYNDNIQTTITSNGRVGYEDVYSTIGVGYLTNGTNTLYEDGLMIGQSSTTVSDCVRGNPAGNSDLDFNPLNNPSFVNSPYKYREVLSNFNDAGATNASPQNIECIQRSYTFNTAEYANTVFLEYKIINHSAADIDSVYVGHFVDWDIENYSSNRASYDVDTRLGYAYDITSNNLYAGICLLTEQDVNYYAMDNLIVGGNNINPNDGFTKAEKFKALSSNLTQHLAGGNSGGTDISMTLAGRINNLKQGDTTTIAFALLTSTTTLLDLKLFAANAKQKFIELHTGPVPLADSIKLCTNTTRDITITPSPGNKFNFYTEEPTAVSIPVFQGQAYTKTNVSTADTIYITNIDSLYESAYSLYIITDKSPITAFSFTAETANTASTFTNESVNYQSALWNFGDNQTSTDINPTHTYTDPGNYIVTLKVSDNIYCTDSLKQTIVIASDPLDISTPVNSLGIKIYPIPADKTLTIEFQQLSTDDIDIEIFNAVGQSMIKKEKLKISNNRIVLDVAALESGLYYIQIKNTNSTLRFVK